MTDDRQPCAGLTTSIWHSGLGDRPDVVSWNGRGSAGEAMPGLMTEAAVHGWDLAKATGQPVTID